MSKDDWVAVENRPRTIDLNDVVACVDCKHYHKTFSMWLGSMEARCLRTRDQKINLVTGKVPKIDVYQVDMCKREREDSYASNCGSRGRYWSPRKKTPENTMRLLKRKQD